MATAIADHEIEERPLPIAKMAKSGSLTASSINETDRSAIFVISTPNPDRSNDIVNPLGVRLENYAKNPVVMFDHGFSGITVPIGKCADPTGKLAMSVSDAGILAKIYFADTVEGDQIFDLVKQGILRAASVSIRPLQSTIRAQGEMRPGYQIDECELLEFSVVSVPDNPEALVKVINGGKLAGKPICEPILKSLRKSAPTGTASGRNSSMPETIQKDGDYAPGDDMAMSATAGNKVKPFGAETLAKCFHAHAAMAKDMECDMGRMEKGEPRDHVHELIDKSHAICDGIAGCYAKNYPEHGELSEREDDVPLTEKSQTSLRAASYRIRRVMKDMSTEQKSVLASVIRAIEQAVIDSKDAASNALPEWTKSVDERLGVMENKMTSAAAKLLEAVPRRSV